MMQDSARRIARIAIESKLDLEEENYVESFRPHLMDVVHAWSSVSDNIPYTRKFSPGENFHQCVLMAELFSAKFLAVQHALYPFTTFRRLPRTVGKFVFF